MGKLKTYINGLYNKVIFGSDPGILNAKYKNNLNIFINHLLPAALRLSLIGSAFLTGVMLHMGFSDTTIAMITLLPSILGIFSLLAGPLLEKLNRKKPFILISCLVVNFFRISVVYIPYVISKQYYLTVFLTMYFIAFSVNAILAVAFNNVYINTMEKGIQAKFIGLRNKISLFFNAIFPLIMAAIVDTVPEGKKYAAFTVMFTLGFVFSVFEVLILRRLKEPDIKRMNRRDINLKNIFLIPVKNKEFMRVTLFSGAFYFTYFISGSFLSVFMLKYLHMSYSVFTLGITLSYAIQFFTYGVGGKIVERFGSKVPTALGILFHSTFSLFFVFATKDTAALWYCLAYVSLAVFVPTFNIAIYKYRFDVMTSHAQTYYDGFYTAVVGIVILIAPIIGGQIKNLIEQIPTVSNMFEFAQFRILFFISFILMALTGVFALLSMKKKNDTSVISKREVKKFILTETFFGKIMCRVKLRKYTKTK